MFLLTFLFTKSSKIFRCYLKNIYFIIVKIFFRVGIIKIFNLRRFYDTTSTVHSTSEIFFNNILKS